MKVYMIFGLESPNKELVIKKVFKTSSTAQKFLETTYSKDTIRALNFMIEECEVEQDVPENDNIAVERVNQIM